jgi:transposase
MSRTGRPKAELLLTDEERDQLLRWSRRAKSSQALALRSKIVLACAEGVPNIEVAERLGINKVTVGKSRARFVEHRLDGLTDEDRPGRPPVISADQVEDVVVATLESTPANATHWTRAKMAERTGLSKSTVGRIWKAFDLKPHRAEGFGDVAERRPARPRHARMTMPPRVRKAMLAVHVASSVGWLGAIAAYIALNVPVVTGADEQLVRAAHLMMKPVAWYAVVPLAVASLVTGIVQALGTPWGLFRHYWVLISLFVTVFATVILLLHLPDVDALAARAADPSSDVNSLHGDLFHSIGGLVVLLVPLVLNLYKPRGLTRYGWRKQQEQRVGGR